MEFVKLVEETRTCRRFMEEQALSAEDAAWIVNCARMCPSTRNAQVLRYITISTQDKCAEVFSHLHWAVILKGKGTPELGERPTTYIVILAPQNASKFVHFDVGIAAQTMHLAARSRGWGCCMHGAFDMAKIKAAIGAPADMDAPLVLALGKAKEICKIEDIPSNGSCDYWRDEDKVHHVPKRKLSECLLAQL